MTAVDLPPLVGTDWLVQHLGASDLRVIDATWYLPHLKRDARAEFARGHISGAVYFDIDAIADRDSPLPHMLPDPEAFARAVGALGIGDGDRVVVYGGPNLIASARAWWMFRVFGHDRVAVLDGGMPRWRAEARPLTAAASVPAARRFTATFRPALVADLARVRASVGPGGEQVLDARSHGRFVATEPEPRPGLRGGHVPGSFNLPYDRLVGEGGSLLPASGLRAAFDATGLDLAQPVITTCGSGVSAAVLALGLYVVGRQQASVYDGSWTEWGGRDDTPVER